MDAVRLAAAASDTSTPMDGPRAVASPRASVDALESRRVEGALCSGESWSAIAAALGVARRVVHEKYAKRPGHIAPVGRGR